MNTLGDATNSDNNTAAGAIRQMPAWLAVVAWGGLAVLIAGLGYIAINGLPGSSSSSGQKPANPAASEPSDPTPTQTSRVPFIDEVPPAPVMPASAKEPTQAGAEAFIQYWFDVTAYAFETAQPELIPTVCDMDNSTVCKKYVASIQTLAESSQYSTGSKRSVTKIELNDKGEVPGKGVAYKFLVTYDSQAEIFRDAEGNVFSENAAEQEALSLHAVYWDRDHWVNLMFLLEDQLTDEVLNG